MASVYRKRDSYYMRVKGPDGIWRNRPCDAITKPAAQLEALAAQQLADRQRNGLAPGAADAQRTFGDLMDLWRERYAPRLRSKTVLLFVEKHLRATLGHLRLGGAAAAVAPLLASKQDELSASSLNHLRAYVRRLYTIAALSSVGWWSRPNPVNRDELPTFKGRGRVRGTLSSSEVLRVLSVLDPRWRPLFATACFLGLRRGELIALEKSDLDLAAGTLNISRSGDADTTKGGHADALPVPAPLRPYLEAALQLSPSRFLFPAEHGGRHALDLDVTAVLTRALGRAGIVEGYQHRCRRAGCGHVQTENDNASRRCPSDGRALWLRPLPRKGITFHSLRHTTATLLAQAKVHPSIAQRILRHADVETTLGIYTHVSDMEGMREALGRLDFGALEECAPAPAYLLERAATNMFGANLVPRGPDPKSEAPDGSRFLENRQRPRLVGATGFEPATTCTPSKCATRLRYAPARPFPSWGIQ